LKAGTTAQFGLFVVHEEGEGGLTTHVGVIGIINIRG
jgi:hypothetical protein